MHSNEFLIPQSLFQLSFLSPPLSLSLSLPPPSLSLSFSLPLFLSLSPSDDYQVRREGSSSSNSLRVSLHLIRMHTLHYQMMPLVALLLLTQRTQAPPHLPSPLLHSLIPSLVQLEEWALLMSWPCLLLSMYMYLLLLQ